ncbi:MAG TPA: efflux RND transporter periplasmic adaptor subunit [Steroidobacteraceae bacterium]|nr:efflux RND transporter periplasmic adaptor subunit [Steroidobacteraceae bacterium]
MLHLATDPCTSGATPVSHGPSFSIAPRIRRGSLIAASAMLLAAGCGREAATPLQPQPVTTLTMRAQPTSLTQDYPAQLEASNTVEIRPQVAGILSKQAALEGSPVKRGQVLFEIDPQPYAAALAQAQAGLAQAHAAEAQAKRDLARARPLSEMDALSERELDAAIAADASAQSQVKAGEAAVKTAELNLAYTTVRSPIDGVMSRALSRLGGVVTAYTTLLTTVYQTDPMYANFSVGEQRLLQVQRELGRAPDQRNPSERRFRILLADGSEYDLPAKMNFVDAAVDTRTDTLAMRLTVPNPRQFLRAGQYIRVLVATQERESALLLPQRAVQHLQDKDYVWIVDGAGRAQQRDVKMGQQQGADWLVDGGLAPGDVVVVDGAQKLKPGMLVHPQPLAAPPRAS